VRASDAALLIIALVVAWSLYRAQRDETIQFNLLDLLVENGRVSKLACVFMGSFFVTSWVIIRVALDGKMTETLFAAYAAAWIIPVTAKLFSGPSPTTTSHSTTSTQTSSTP